MNTTLIEKFAPVICSLSPAELACTGALSADLLMAKDGPIEVYYAPFEYVNPAARIVIVGITPGRTQMANALKEARRQLDADAEFAQVLSAAKSTAAFSGAMRPNLIALLDHVGLGRWLGLSSCGALFGSAAHLVQTASALCNPVFLNGENYNGTPNMTRHPLLRAQLLAHFAPMVERMPGAVFVPLGDKVADALSFLADEGVIDRCRILDGLPHPSGANSERIAYFLGRKSRADLSAKTDPAKLDQARAHLQERVLALA